MSFLTTTTELFAPILGILFGGIVLAVIVVTVVSAVRGNGAGAVAYFIYGLCLVSLVIVVTTAGIVTHSVSELVGPGPQIYSAAPLDCASPPGTSSPTSLPIKAFYGTGGFCYGSSQSASAASPSPPATSPPVSSPQVPSPPSASPQFSPPGVSSPLVGSSATGDDSNHFISVSVLAGLFGVTASATFLLLWRRARRLTNEVGLGDPPVGLLPVTYGYLVAGIAVLSLLVFGPIFADNIFRAIAPGVNETSGHADGLRNLVTYFLLAGLTGFILRYHLQYLKGLRNPPIGAQPLPAVTGEEPEFPGLS